jgi:hypothetical protein
MGMRAAINAKCRDCIYDPLSGGGNWRQQVQACTITRCPLHPYRPLSRGAPKLPAIGTKNDKHQ